MLDVLLCVQFLMLCHILKANGVKWGSPPAEHTSMETLAGKFTCPGDVIFETLLADSFAGRFSHMAFLS